MRRDERQREIVSLADWVGSLLCRLSWQRWLSPTECEVIVRSATSKAYPYSPRLRYRLVGEVLRHYPYAAVGLVRGMPPCKPEGGISKRFWHEIQKLDRVSKERRGARAEMLCLLEQVGALDKQGNLWLTK